MPSALDPTFIADGTPVSKPAFRDQLLTLRAELEHGGFVTNPVTLAESTASQALADLHAAMPGARVETVAELQAIPPTPGRVVEVLGYHAPGDGGGGLFYADTTGAQQTDGGMVFGCTADESTEQTLANQPRANFTAGVVNLPENIVWGSVSITPTAGSSLVVSDIAMHGHRMSTVGNGLYPLLDHKTGVFHDDLNGAKRIELWLLNGASSANANIKYKTLGNARRWVRLVPANWLDVRWFGAVSDGTTDSRDRIAWALNAAMRLGYKEVRLNGDGFRYYGALEIPDGVTFGWGKLTAVDTKVLEHLRNDFLTTHPDWTVQVALQSHQTSIHPADNSMYWGLRDLELDGNYQNNLEALQNFSLYTRDGGMIANVQNSPVWSGFSATNHGGRVIPIGQKARMDNVDIHGYGNNCLVASGNCTITGVDVRLGDSVKNHPFYSIHGTFTNLTLYGFCWGSYGKSEWVNIYGLHVERLRNYDFTPDASYSAGSQILAYEGSRRGPGTAKTGSSLERWHQTGIHIIGGHWDLEGLPGNGPLIFGAGQQCVVRDVSIYGPLAGAGATEVTLFRESTLGSETELYENWTWHNVNVMQRGVPIAWDNNNDLSAGIATLDGFAVQDLPGYEGQGGTAGRFVSLIAGPPRTGPNATIPRRAVLSRVRTTRGVFNLAVVDVTDASATPIDLVVRDSTLSLASKTIIRNLTGGSGSVAGLTLASSIDKLRVLMENTSFEISSAGSDWQNLELFFAIGRFRNCRTFDGRVSEQSGTVELSGTQTDIATDLFWEPKAVSLMPRDSGMTIQYYQLFDSAGATNLEGAANTVDRRSPIIRVFHSGTGTLAWNAAVRPF